jgi:hypothetical protein
VYYSRNLSTPKFLTTILGVQTVFGTGKYHGLTSMVGRSKKATSRFIKDWVWQKNNSWSNKCLSILERKVMIKSVLQDIISYIMSIFLLPLYLNISKIDFLGSFI